MADECEALRRRIDSRREQCERLRSLNDAIERNIEARLQDVSITAITDADTSGAALHHLHQHDASPQASVATGNTSASAFDDTFLTMTTTASSVGRVSLPRCSAHVLDTSGGTHQQVPVGLSPATAMDSTALAATPAPVAPPPRATKKKLTFSLPPQDDVDDGIVGAWDAAGEHGSCAAGPASLDDSDCSAVARTPLRSLETQGGRPPRSSKGSTPFARNVPPLPATDAVVAKRNRHGELAIFDPEDPPLWLPQPGQQRRRPTTTATDSGLPSAAPPPSPNVPVSRRPPRSELTMQASPIDDRHAETGYTPQAGTASAGASYRFTPGEEPRALFGNTVPDAHNHQQQAAALTAAPSSTSTRKAGQTFRRSDSLEDVLNSGTILVAPDSDRRPRRPFAPNAAGTTTSSPAVGRPTRSPNDVALEDTLSRLSAELGCFPPSVSRQLQMSTAVGNTTTMPASSEPSPPLVLRERDRRPAAQAVGQRALRLPGPANRPSVLLRDYDDDAPL